MAIGPITEEITKGVKLAYYVKETDGRVTYNEVHFYPERGDLNLDGWSEILEIDENGRDPSRTPENQSWTAFEFNNLHLAENDNEVATAWFTSLGTNVVYNNGADRDIKTYVGAGFKYQLVDQYDKGGNDLVIASL